jgi:hypothetical protein
LVTNLSKSQPPISYFWRPIPERDNTLLNTYHVNSDESSIKAAAKQGHTRCCNNAVMEFLKGRLYFSHPIVATQ